MFTSWLVCVIAVALSVTFLIESFSLQTMVGSDPGGPALFPRIVIAITLLATAVTVVRLVRTSNLRLGVETAARFMGVAAGSGDERFRSMRRVTFVMLLSLVYPWAMLKIGFILGTALFVAILMQMFRQGLVVTAAMSFGVAFAIHYLFAGVLSVRVTPGEWFDLVRFLGI